MTARLSEFRIEGLFGLYNHRIPLNKDSRITIIIGPNGRGKTVCLKFIEAFYQQNYKYFIDIPFERAEFHFNNGYMVFVERKFIEKGPADPVGGGSFCLKIFSPYEEVVEWTPSEIDSRLKRELRRFIPPSWEQVSTYTWMDRTDGEELTPSELAERYHIPERLSRSLQQEIPAVLTDLVKAIDCHLIETQRLLVLPRSGSGEIEDFGVFNQSRRRGRDSDLAIQDKAEKLKDILSDTLTSYANLSQSLDRTFPFRVFDAKVSPTYSQEELRAELRQLDERRRALMSAGILATEDAAVTMRGGSIDRGVAMALQIYVGDAKRKLDVFNGLRSKLDLFKELIEGRFLDKTVHIDRENGLKIVSKTGSVVPLDKLSSGEQHQLVMIFDMLFEVGENSMILIDEPELSLHVAWQKTFIESLKKIIALNAFDVVLATHSPAIVSRYFDMAVELGKVDA